MTRTPQQIFDHHTDALLARNLDDLIADYTDRSALITSTGTARGTHAIRAAFAKTFDATPSDAVFTVQTRIFEDNVLFLEWQADAPSVHIEGTDSFVFDDNSILTQTVRHSAHPKG